MSEKFEMEKMVDIVLPDGHLEGTSATFASWLIKEGQFVNKGVPVAELETDKVTMEVCASTTGKIVNTYVGTGDEIKAETVLGKIEMLVPTDSTERNAPLSHFNQKPSSHLFSPAVRRLLQENNLSTESIAELVQGSGKGGRVTRDDMLHYLQLSVKPSHENEAFNEAQFQSHIGQHIPHSNMRKSIANHMVKSLLQTSPHVTSLFEMDMGNVIEHCKWHKKEYEAQGVKLTYTAYFLAAMAVAVKAVPEVNARYHEKTLEVFDDVNIGVGTAMGDSGIVVPVVSQVQTKRLFEIAKALNCQTEKARSKMLTPKDMKNGTITISNHGVSGSLIAVPIIINQPQVAIMGVGKLEKRVVVEEVNGIDTMVIRPKCYVSLSIDHRALDAYQTNHFLSVFVERIETWGS